MGTRRRWGAIKVLREIVPEGMNNLGEQEWEEIEMTIDVAPRRPS